MRCLCGEVRLPSFADSRLERSLPFLRILQLCAVHDAVEKKFLEQASKAGKEQALRCMKTSNAPEYLRLLVQFGKVWLGCIR